MLQFRKWDVTNSEKYKIIILLRVAYYNQVIGFILLIKGADILVDGSSAIAKRMRISEIVIGLTIVSIGTSMPELFISITSALNGHSDMAIGNVIGSNISNLLLILGLSAFIRPIAFKKEARFIEIPMCLFFTFVFVLVCNIGQNVVVSPGVKLGRNVKIQNNVSVYTGVVCEDDVFLGPSMVFTNVINPRSAVSRKDEYKQTILRRGASVGANATIVCGNEIGEYALIGAGAVITKSVPAYALVVGNPARQIGWVSEYGHRLEFDDEGLAVCPETRDVYKLEEGKVRKVES